MQKGDDQRSASQESDDQESDDQESASQESASQEGTSQEGGEPKDDNQGRIKNCGKEDRSQEIDEESLDQKIIQSMIGCGSQSLPLLVETTLPICPSFDTHFLQVMKRLRIVLDILDEANGEDGFPHGVVLSQPTKNAGYYVERCELRKARP